MRDCVSGWRRSFAATVLILSLAAPAWAAPVFNGGSGIVAFGVTPYGVPIDNDGPTFIANNFTGRSDILSSPGLGSLNGFLTANPIVANNIFSLGPLGLTVAGFQFGGGNGFGPFGAGFITNSGPRIGINLADSGPGGGSASYGITSEISTWTNVGAVVPAGATYGAFIGMAGNVPLVGNADVLSLKVLITDTANAFGVGGTALPNLVLAISRNGSGNTLANYNIVTLGGLTGANAALILDNGATGAFHAGAVDTLALTAAIPIGDVITVTATLTGFADPANFSTFDLTGSDLLPLLGPLPTIDFVSNSTVPEPTSLVLGGMGSLFVLGCFVRSSRKRSSRSPSSAA